MRINLTSLLLASALTVCSVPAFANGAEEDFTFVRTSNTPAFETDFTVAAEQTVNAVVCIKSYVTPRRQNYGSGYYDPFDMFDFFFGQPQQRQQPQQRNRKNDNKSDKSEQVQSGLGSGVIISADGYIVTNNHVVDEAERLEVILNDNTSYDAKIIGTDEATDLALIKIDAKGLSPIKFGDSEAVKIGEWVLAVGNPFGFNSTVTAGIVSAKARSISSKSNKGGLGIESFIQTDAALNPGNSGGALVNLNGELIGINAAIYSNTGSYSGFSFAIPTSIVKKVMNDIKLYGTVQRAVLGISGGNLDAKLAKEKDITLVKSGVLVASVEEASTARELGLEPDDVIIEVNSVAIHAMPELQEQISKFRPGEKVTVTFVRKNKKHTATATLRNRQGGTEIAKKSDFTQLGCAFKELSQETRRNLGISYGVEVSGLSSGLMKKAGVANGFIIQTINDEPVNSADDVEAAYESAMRDDKVLILRGMLPTGKRKVVVIEIEE